MEIAQTFLSTISLGQFPKNSRAIPEKQTAQGPDPCRSLQGQQQAEAPCMGGGPNVAPAGGRVGGEI